MNLKRVFGVILTVLGIAGLIYAAMLFLNGEGSGKQIKSLAVYGILGGVFFFTGIGLIKGTHDESQPPAR
ncbi:hypothetical protein SAMN05444008_11124 [Cnuella takakiae]|uniref:Uncharacterized protein n=1 Tax=Cnuella takakiae TaxID=1302690 RepID=A0A1M5DPA5_9BACT|nr:hypothetical protein [Cnuella takakiae]OLY93920.1 hypothetical protein BUE76_20075 [Cnuella takakiae]SHF68714.1 hypothetical protein SAMN05444008_11124 [Cnuella takakiae]